MSLSREHVGRLVKEGKHLHLCTVCGAQSECKNPLCGEHPGSVIYINGYLDGCTKCLSRTA